MVTATVTLPPELRDRLDATAAAMERSRSWVVTKAVDQFLSQFADSGRSSAPPDGDKSCSTPPTITMTPGGGIPVPRDREFQFQDNTMDNPTDSTAIANATRAAALHGIYNRQVETLDRLAATEQAKAQAAREARDRVMAQNAAYLTGGKL